MTQIKYGVLLTKSAEQDLESIYDYIAEFDSPKHADQLLNQLIKVIETLSQNPERGNYPKELSALGIREYRQTFCKPYRIIYRIIQTKVVIYLIFDGRRNMQSVLEKRLLAVL